MKNDTVSIIVFWNVLRNSFAADIFEMTVNCALKEIKKKQNRGWLCKLGVCQYSGTARRWLCHSSCTYAGFCHPKVWLAGDTWRQKIKPREFHSHSDAAGGQKEDNSELTFLVFYIGGGKEQTSNLSSTEGFSVPKANGEICKEWGEHIK